MHSRRTDYIHTSPSQLSNPMHLTAHVPKKREIKRAPASTIISFIFLTGLSEYPMIRPEAPWPGGTILVALVHNTLDVVHHTSPYDLVPGRSISRAHNTLDSYFVRFGFDSTKRNMPIAKPNAPDSIRFNTSDSFRNLKYLPKA